MGQMNTALSTHTAFRKLLLATAALCVAAGVALGQEEFVLYDFEGSTEGWHAATDGAGLPAGVCAYSSVVQSTGQQSLQIGSTGPGVTGACVNPPAGKRNWHRFTHLTLRVYASEDAPQKVQLIVYLKDTDLCYYQHLRPTHLRRGGWTEVSLDLTSRSDCWTFQDHYKPWDAYCKQDVQELGVKFVCKTPYSGAFYLDSITLKCDPSVAPETTTIYNLRANNTVVGRYEKLELSFNLGKAYSNPFDPDVIDVRAHFICPDGQTATVPGFFYQGYLRRMVKGAERLAPMGHSQWKVRFAPTQVGTYHYYVELTESPTGDGGVVRSEMGRFQCEESGSRGFVRISKQDPLFFEFDDGTFYFPIGHNVASVHDDRAKSLQVNIPASERTFAYDRMLSRMAENGESFIRLWMSPWSFGLEWTKAYDVHYRGLGRYNLRNAWRLDHVIRTAEQHSVYAMLLFTAHGEIGDYESDFWGHDSGNSQGSPYWNGRRGSQVHPGYDGPIGGPAELYTSAEALECYKKRARYIVARWGYSPAIMAWEILNEPDLASFYQNNRFGSLGATFVSKVARHIRSHDPAAHLITSGCFRYQQHYARPTLELAELDFNTGHVFGGELESLLYADTRRMQRTYGKIFLATEAGLTPFAQDPDITALAIHRTLWSSYMVPGAGAAAPWWWVLIDRRNLYPHFRALSAFAEGEDRRAKGYDKGNVQVQDPAGKRQLRGMVLRNAEEAFGWVYDPVSFSSRGKWEEARGAAAAITVRGMRPGAYRIEVWDTYAGKIVRELDCEAREEAGDHDAAESRTSMTFETPEFARDLAFKIKPR